MNNANQNNINIFNVIRAVAVICVFIMHAVITIKTVANSVVPWFLYTPAWGAMWIFYFISGYLIGKGFYKGKYKTDIKGIKNFYISRLIRIVPPYFFFLLICFIFIDPQWFINNTQTVFRLLTFTYNGSTGIVGIGATWFISTIIQLYLLAPLGYRFVITKIKNIKFAFFVILSIGLIIRFVEYDLHSSTFFITIVSPISNLDLFFGGMLLNSMIMDSTNNINKQFCKMFSWIFLSLIILASIILIFNGGVYFCMYAYVFPSLYLLSMLFLVYSYDTKDKIQNVHLSIKSYTILNPVRLLEFLGIISFEFYLYHSNILDIFARLIPQENNNIYIFKTIFFSFIITCVFSYIIYIAIEKPANKYRSFLKERND
ncbi:MAG: acyltransferase [Endomicrobiia bacterium]